MSKVDWSKLPSTLPSGGMLPHMSAKLRREIVDTVFQASGGTERLLSWVEQSDDNYETFITKLWGPGQAKAVSAEVEITQGVEDLLLQLDRSDSAKVVGGETTSSQGAPVRFVDGDAKRIDHAE